MLLVSFTKFLSTKTKDFAFLAKKRSILLKKKKITENMELREEADGWLESRGMLFNVYDQGLGRGASALGNLRLR